MARSSFFKDGGAGTNTAAAIQNQLDIAASSAAQAAESLASIGTELADATAARVAAEAAQAASETAKTASEAARDTAITNRNAADASASAASTSEGNSQTSETNASGSASAAATSAQNAATSATNAAASETNIGNAETNAASSATAAQTAQTAAQTAQTAAETAQTSASNSASAASTSETNAGTSATAAATSATNAATSATTATTKASEASTSATNAATSETNAGNSATAAASSATAAAASQTAAAASAASAATTYDQFDDRYHGSLSSNPSTDPDGNALAAGMLYFNSTAGEMRVFDGSSWIAASAATNASLILYEYTATAGQTTFSGSDDNSATLSYTVDNLQVVMNGVVLDPADFTATNGTSVVLDSGATVGDQVNIYAFKSFTTADMVSKTAGGTFSGAVGFSGGITGDVSFDTNTLHVDSTNNRVGVGTTSPSHMIHAKTTGSDYIFSESSSSSANVGFRAKNGDRDWYILNDASGVLQFYDGTDTAERMRIDSSGNVSIGGLAAHSELDVRGAGEIFTVQGDGGASAEMNLSLINGTVNKSCIINFGKNLSTSDRYLGRIIYEVDNNNMDFYTNGSNKFRIQTSGNIVQTSSISAGWSYAHNMTASSGQLLGNLIQFTAQAPNNNTNYFLYMTDNVGPRAYFTANGGLHNYQGNNSNLSDEREKKNIEDAQDAWATVKSWQVRKFHFNEDADSDDKRYGVIAQEFETSCPELISEFNRSPDPTSEPILRKGVKEQGAMWLAIKALQEAQAKIETLETKVASLETQNADFETRLTALEAE